MLTNVGVFTNFYPIGLLLLLEINVKDANLVNNGWQYYWELIWPELKSYHLLLSANGSASDASQKCIIYPFHMRKTRVHGWQAKFFKKLWSKSGST